MAEVVIHNLDPTLLEKLEVLAQKHGRSLQSELKRILEEAVQAEFFNQNEKKTVGKTPAELSWNSDFFESTARKWEGELLTRGEQGEYKQRL